MDQIKKLLRKVSHTDRKRLLEIVEKLQRGDLKVLRAKKVQGTEFYRIRSGRFCIIFHHNKKTGSAIVDSIRMRNEGTYKDC